MNMARNPVSSNCDSQPSHTEQCHVSLPPQPDTPKLTKRIPAHTHINVGEKISKKHLVQNIFINEHLYLKEHIYLSIYFASQVRHY